MNTRSARAGALLTLLLLLLAITSAAAAAPLTGGNTLYLINGAETQFLFDPIQRKDGQLLSQEVFERLGVSPSPVGPTITLQRAEAKVTLTLGETEAEVNGESFYFTPAPVRIGERLFLPLSLLPELGFTVAVDTGVVQIRDVGRDLPVEPGWDLAEWTRRKQLATQMGVVRSDDQRGYLSLEVTHLTPELVASRHFPARFGQRALYLDQLKRGTAFLVRAANHSGRSVTLQPSSLMLVDGNGRQYNLRQALEHQGLVSQTMAYGAVTSTVLLFERVPDRIDTVSLFAETNQSNFGSFRLRR